MEVFSHKIYFCACIYHWMVVGEKQRSMSVCISWDMKLVTSSYVADCLAAERRRTTAADNIQRETTTILLHIITSNGRHFMFCICLARRHCMLFQNSLQSLRFHLFLSLFFVYFHTFCFYSAQLLWLGLGVHFLFRKTDEPNTQLWNFHRKGKPINGLLSQTKRKCFAQNGSTSDSCSSVAVTAVAVATAGANVTIIIIKCALCTSPFGCHSILYTGLSFGDSLSTCEFLILNEQLQLHIIIFVHCERCFPYASMHDYLCADPDVTFANEWKESCEMNAVYRGLLWLCSAIQLSDCLRIHITQRRSCVSFLHIRAKTFCSVFIWETKGEMHREEMDNEWRETLCFLHKYDLRYSRPL